MEFQSIAEATATYAQKGFRTVFELDDCEQFERVMRRGKDLVMIRQAGFLRIEAIEYLEETD